MELMLVLAPYNQGLLDLLQQGGNVVACRISLDGEEMPAEATPTLLSLVTEAAQGVSDFLEGADITAAEAAERADGATLLGGPTTPVEALYKTIWPLILTAVRERSASKKRNLTITPFASIAGKEHKPPMEDEVMAKVVTNLESRQYKGIKWRRIDGRVVLTFAW